MTEQAVEQVLRDLMTAMMLLYNEVATTNPALASHMASHLNRAAGLLPDRPRQAASRRKDPIEQGPRQGPGRPRKSPTL